MAADAAAGEKPVPLAKLVGLLVAQCALFTAIGAGLWDVSGGDLDHFVTFEPWEFGYGLVFGAALIAAAAAVFHGFPRLSEQLVRLQADTYRFLGPRLGWGAIVTISLAAGIGEEALLRGGVQTWLSGHVGAAGAIALASAAFAAMHMAKPVITALLLVIGIVFGVVYWQTGSLLTVMIAHALYDVWALRYLHREMVRLGLVEDAPPG